MTTDFRQRLTARAMAGGVQVPPEVSERVEAYYRILSTWNRKMNLTALDLDALPPEAIDRLFVEPLAAAAHAEAGLRAIDIGSGGGSPAIPFAIAAASSRLVMVESRTRKAVFLREAARAAGVTTAEVINARFEEVVGDPSRRQDFDVLTIRAVRVDALVLDSLRTLLTASGQLFLFQSRLETAPAAATAVRRQPLTAETDLVILNRDG